jgi:hypothetical protein
MRDSLLFPCPAEPAATDRPAGDRRMPSLLERSERLTHVGSCQCAKHLEASVFNTDQILPQACPLASQTEAAPDDALAPAMVPSPLAQLPALAP